MHCTSGGQGALWVSSLLLALRRGSSTEQFNRYLSSAGTRGQAPSFPLITVFRLPSSVFCPLSSVYRLNCHGLGIFSSNASFLTISTGHETSGVLSLDI